MDDMEEVPGVHGDGTKNACPTPSPGGLERGPFGNITSCTTICISSMVKELKNITGSEEPWGAVEIEYFSSRGMDEAPSDTAYSMIWEKSNTTCMSGHQEREQSVESIRYGTFDHYLEAQQQYAWLFRHTV
jgi:hypothetical protein